MSKKRKKIFAFVTILLGVLIFSYPIIATTVNNYFASKVIREYENKISNMDKDEIESMMKMALEYNQSLPHSYPADPFSKNNISDFEGTKFENFIMVKEGSMIGYLEVPSINIYLPIYYGTGNKVIEKNLGLVENTSLPVGGAGTHAVIAGHTGMASRKLFSDLNQMHKGDLFFVHVLNRHFAYKVDDISVVLPEETKKLEIKKDLDLVTLLTCTPFGINDHRLLVRGARTDYDFSEKQQPLNNSLLFNRLLLILLMICIVGLILILKLKKKEFKNLKRRN